MKFLKRTLIAIFVLFLGLYIWANIYSIEPGLVVMPAIAEILLRI